MSGSSLHHSIVANQEDWFDGTTFPQLFATSENPDSILDGQAPHVRYTVLPPPDTPPGLFVQSDSSLSQEVMGVAAFYGPADPFQHQSFPQECSALVTGDEALAPFYRQNDHTSEDFYPGDRCLSTELSHGYGTYNEEGLQYWEETLQPRNTAAEPRVHFGDNLEPTQTLDAGEHADQLPHHPVGPEKNQVKVPVYAEPPPAVTNDTHSKKRKREPATDQKGDKPRGKRSRPEEPQDSEEEQRIPDPAAPPPRPGLLPLLQTKYRCESAQKRWNLHPPITFTVGGIPGINLVDAKEMRFPKLDGRDDLMFEGDSTGNSISLRIKFVDYQPAKGSKARQIATKDHKVTHNRITRQKLGFEIAKLIGVHLKGDSPFHIPIKDMYLVRLHHVSHASWQPEIWYRDPQGALQFLREPPSPSIALYPLA